MATGMPWTPARRAMRGTLLTWADAVIEGTPRAFAISTERAVDLVVRVVILEADVVRVEGQAGDTASKRSRWVDGPEVVEGDRQPPAPHLVPKCPASRPPSPRGSTWPCHSSQRAMRGTLLTRDADGEHAVDEAPEVAVAEAVALHADQHAADARLAARLRLHLPAPRPGRPAVRAGQKARRHQLVPFPSRQHRHFRILVSVLISGSSLASSPASSSPDSSHRAPRSSASAGRAERRFRRVGAA